MTGRGDKGGDVWDHNTGCFLKEIQSVVLSGMLRWCQLSTIIWSLILRDDSDIWSGEFMGWAMGGVR